MKIEATNKIIKEIISEFINNCRNEELVWLKTEAEKEMRRRIDIIQESERW